MQPSDYAKWFRGSTPYISAHRGKTFVILLSGEALENSNITNIVHDLALLHVLGVRLVVVHGVRNQLNDALPDGVFHDGKRITDLDSMTTAIGINGQIRAKLEAAFSTGLPNTPMHNVDITVTSGNFVIAKPIGVLDGIDHLFTGQVRRIETKRIAKLIDTNAIVLQSPVGYSPSGQAFNLAAEDLAAEIAISIGADKLIALDALPYLTEPDGDDRISGVTPGEAEAHAPSLSETSAASLGALARAVTAGVNKGHLVSYLDDGALLEELFTAAGVGTQISATGQKPVRQASVEDVSEIVEIIRPLEEAGVLVRRSRDRLEQEIAHFLVAELDAIVVGCCAVYLYGDQAELACIGVHQNYRVKGNVQGIGASLLAAAETKAKTLGAATLFVLTTQTRDWFVDHGFADADVNVLPDQKQSLYNWQRNSKVLVKHIAN